MTWMFRARANHERASADRLRRQQRPRPHLTQCITACGRLRWTVLLPLALIACSTAGAVDQSLPEVETLIMHERARQVTVSTGHGLARLDSNTVEEGVAGAILLNSDLIVDGVFRDAGLSSTVEGGRIVGTMHGQCTTVGGALSLSAAGTPGTIAKCEQGLNFYDRGQVLVSGLIEQQNFEHNVPQHLAVIGGTDRFVGAVGELIVTQLVFPGVIKRLELRLEHKL
jgi:hypothetical protein